MTTYLSAAGGGALSAFVVALKGCSFCNVVTKHPRRTAAGNPRNRGQRGAGVRHGACWVEAVMSYRRERRPTRWRVRSSLPNPIEDPLRKEKRKPGQVGRRLTPREQNEFAPIDVVEIRWRFDQTQAEFATMMGISIDTLRNWERGRRHPQGPARSLLRIANADPEMVAKALTRERRVWELEELKGVESRIARWRKKKEKERAEKEAARQASNGLPFEEAEPADRRPRSDLSWLLED